MLPYAGQASVRQRNAVKRSMIKERSQRPPRGFAAMGNEVEVILTALCRWRRSQFICNSNARFSCSLMSGRTVLGLLDKKWRAALRIVPRPQSTMCRAPKILGRVSICLVIPVIASFGVGKACAKNLLDQSAAFQESSVEAADGNGMQFQGEPGSNRSPTLEASMGDLRIIASGVEGEARMVIDRGNGVPQVVTGRTPAFARVTVGGSPAGAQVTASRMSDIVGRPVDIFRPISIGRPYSGPLPSRMPVAARTVTSGFGLRVHPVLGGIRAHSGVDLAAPYGTPVVATSNGVVGEADWRGGYGLFVSVRHGGLETRYGHMSRLNVVSGQRVRQGDVIGYVGSTGRSTGPHLHYEVRVNGRAVNPLKSKSK